MVTALLVTPFVTRGLGPLEYGFVALAVSVYQIATVVLPLGLPAAVTRHVLLEGSGRRGAVGLVVLALPIAACVAGVAAGIWLLVARDRPDSAVVALALLCAWALSISALVLSHLRGVNRVGAFVALSIGQSWLGPALGLAAIGLVSAKGTTYVAGLALGHLVMAGAALAVMLQKDRPDISWRGLRRAVEIGFPTIPHQLALVAASSLLVVVATGLWGSDAAGRLQLAVVVGSLPTVMIGAFNNAWAPMVYATESAERSRAIEQTARLMAGVAGALSVGVALLAPVALEILGSEEMRGADEVSATAVVAIAAPFMVLYLANVHLVFVTGRTRMLALITPLSVAAGYTFALAATAVVPGNRSWALATAFPVFYAIQSLQSGWLRGRLTGVSLDLRGPLLVAVAAAMTCILVAALRPGMGLRVGLAALVAALAAWLVLVHRGVKEVGAK